MNIIEINIGNKKYKISCNNGEEEHILDLSRKLNQKYCNLAKNLGDKASDSLILVIMGLMLEDEVHNLDNNVKPLPNLSEQKLPFICKKVDTLIEQLESLKVA